MRKLANAELDRKNIEEFKEAQKTPIIVILNDIRSLHNIGSVFRTSDAFLIEKIYLCGITAIPPNKEIHKTALGATDTVTWEYAKDVLEVISILKAENNKIYAIEQTENAIMLDDFQPESETKYALIFGAIFLTIFIINNLNKRFLNILLKSLSRVSLNSNFFYLTLYLLNFHK